MSWFLGLDTSNYTTSTALYDSQTGQVYMEKQLLPVKEKACGLRQSDAVFLHVKQLGKLCQKLLDEHKVCVEGIGVSTRPRNAEGSYMPCFLVGDMAADLLSAGLGTKRYSFSHQQGHIAAALYSAGALSWLEDSRFYAFHVSGGTTEVLQVTAKDGDMQVSLLGKTLDLNAGQVIDRVGVMLGLSFPCGRQLEQLALSWDEPVSAKVKLKGIDCCLSGVENQCQALFREGKPKEYIARYCLEVVKAAVLAMTREVFRQYGEKPVIYAGGVMSNSLIRQAAEEQFSGKFAAAEYSTDNAAGVAVLAGLAHERRKEETR